MAGFKNASDASVKIRIALQNVSYKKINLEY